MISVCLFFALAVDGIAGSNVVVFYSEYVRNAVLFLSEQKCEANTKIEN